MKEFKVKIGDKSYFIRAKNDIEAFKQIKDYMYNKKTETELEDDRLSPMTYKKLKEMGYGSEDWKDLTQEAANKIVKSGQKETQKSSGRRGQTEESSENSFSKSNEEDFMTPKYKDLGELEEAERKASEDYAKFTNLMVEKYKDVVKAKKGVDIDKYTWEREAKAAGVLEKADLAREEELYSEYNGAGASRRSIEHSKFENKQIEKQLQQLNNLDLTKADPSISNPERVKSALEGYLKKTAEMNKDFVKNKGADLEGGKPDLDSYFERVNAGFAELQKYQNILKRNMKRSSDYNRIGSSFTPNPERILRMLSGK